MFEKYRHYLKVIEEIFLTLWKKMLSFELTPGTKIIQVPK